MSYKSGSWKILKHWEMETRLEILYSSVLGELKEKIRESRQRASLSVNYQLLAIYWEIGKTILQQQSELGWGAKVIDRLSADLRTEFPGMKGLSVRNMKYMRAFAEAWPFFPFVQPPAAQIQGSILQRAAAKLDDPTIVQTPSAQLQYAESPPDIIVQTPLAQITWSHHVLLLNKIRDPEIREFYLSKTIQNGWSLSVLAAQISSCLHHRIGKAISNFETTLPGFRSDLARETFKNPYVLEFIDLSEEVRERELEQALLHHLKKFMLELGKGFAYVGNQFNLNVAGDDFFTDLLFFNFHLNCFVVFELKVGDFQPEFAGKLNFYINCIDEQVKGKEHNPTIGVLLCKTPNQTVIKYSLKSIGTPIGVADYELRKTLPKKLAKQMPTIEELEEQLKSLNEE
jgi:predicted nuclease of restriction endonuclease-like (RecB) superfamily